MNDRSGFILSLSVAVAENGVIGRDGQLPWRLPSDLRRFRKLTMGHPLIMGRKTYASIGKPLDGRDTIVVTRTPAILDARQDLYAVRSLEEALQTARGLAEKRGVHEAFVIGGAALFSLALSRADRIYLTLVHGSPEGDVHWLPPSSSDWIELKREFLPASERDDFPVTDLILERRSGA